MSRRRDLEGLAVPRVGASATGPDLAVYLLDALIAARLTTWAGTARNRPARLKATHAARSIANAASHV